MKGFYKKILNFFSWIPVKIEIIKTFLAEWRAILRKKPLYKDVKWSKEQQKEFDLFWRENYGKKFSNRWHRLYEASNGIHRIDYIPEILFSVKLEPLLNDYTCCKVFSDKTLNDLLFDNKIENVRTPKYFLFNSHGKFYNSERELISKEQAAEIIGNIGMAVIKPTVDSSSGENVKIIDMHDGNDQRTNKSATEIIEAYKSNFIVQERIKPCEELKKLYPTAINTIRVTSYILNDTVYVTPISLRIGCGGGEIDNIHAGGISIGVDEDGALRKYAYRLGYGDLFDKYDRHPDTDVVFERYRLSFVKDLVSAAKRLHTMTSNVGIISWDFTVDSEGYIVVIEANYSGQSAWFPQMLSGESLFGENTKKVLKYIREKG